MLNEMADLPTVEGVARDRSPTLKGRSLGSSECEMTIASAQHSDLDEWKPSFMLISFQRVIFIGVNYSC